MTEDTKTNPLENSLCLSLTLGKFGVSKKVKNDSIEVVKEYNELETDKTLLKVSKKIFDSEIYQKICSLDGGVNQYLKAHTIINVLMKTGLYLVPLGKVVDIENYLQTKKQERSELVQQLKTEYNSIKEYFEEHLGSLYNEKDYPTAERMTSKFFMEISWVAFDVPAKLKAISENIFQREAAHAKEQIQVIAERVEELLCSSTDKLLKHLIERLEDRSDGKQKKFDSDMIDRAREFFTELKSRNITSSDRLNDLANDGLSLLEGVNAIGLRNSGTFRNETRVQFIKMQESLTNMIQSQPNRGLRITDDEVEV